MNLEASFALITDAFNIADQAARSLIQGESVVVAREDGSVWWDTRTADAHTDAWRLHFSYLKARGLIQHDKAQPWLVQILEES
jgi:hypothetical protein